MSKLEDLMPADLRERLRTRPPRELPSALRYLETTGRGWLAERPAAETAARRRAEAWQAVEADVRAWREAALTSGQIVASGWPAGKVGMTARVRIPAEAWAALRYHSGKNAAVARASGAVVFEGLDFEVAAPKRGPGRPKAAQPKPADDEAVRLLLRDAPGMTREEFRRRAKPAMPGAKMVEMDALWRKAREKRREIAGEKRRISTPRQRV